MSGFYILFDDGPIDGIDGQLVRQENRNIPNGSPAMDGELARSRTPFEAAGKKWLGGELVDMSEVDLATLGVWQAAQADAAEHVRAEQSGERQDAGCAHGAHCLSGLAGTLHRPRHLPCCAAFRVDTRSGGRMNRCLLKRFISSILNHPGNPFFFSFLALGFITGFTNAGLVCGASIAAMFLVTVGPIYLFGAWIGRNDA